MYHNQFQNWIKLLKKGYHSPMKKIILASQSPRRKQLIQSLGVPVIIQTADFDESTVSDPDPAQDAIVTSLGKAEAVAQLQENPAIIIGSDTNVALGDLLLGKPVDSAEAIRTLKLLRNKPHQVHTGIALINQYTGETFTDVATIQVTMRNYSDAEIEAYVASGSSCGRFYRMLQRNCWIARLSLGRCVASDGRSCERIGRGTLQTASLLRTKRT